MTIKTPHEKTVAVLDTSDFQAPLNALASNGYDLSLTEIVEANRPLFLLDSGSLDRADRSAKWDSCYTTDLSYIHGGSIRTSSTSRYRQWMLHKLAYWLDQFRTFGCVGCGRCIARCPRQ